MVQYAASAFRSDVAVVIMGQCERHQQSPVRAMVFVNQFRFNVVDPHGVSSFIGPAHALKIITAACSRGATDLHQVLEMAIDYDREWALDVKRGIRIFDEHNVDTLCEAFQEVGQEGSALQHHPFRVLDTETRRRSMVPARLGLVVFNLKAQRIIQIQNSYATLERHDRGRIRREGRPTTQIYTYKLPDAWSIVP